MLLHIEQTPEVRVLFEHQREALEADGDGVTSVVDRASDGVMIRIVAGTSSPPMALRVERGAPLESKWTARRSSRTSSTPTRLDLREHVTTPAKLYWILHPEAVGSLIAHHIERRWCITCRSAHRTNEQKTTLQEVFRARIAKALGIAAESIQIESISFLAHDRAGGPDVSPWQSLLGRRCGAPVSAHGRTRNEHRHRGCAQPMLEARRGSQRRGKGSATRHVPKRAASSCRSQLRREQGQLR